MSEDKPKATRARRLSDTSLTYNANAIAQYLNSAVDSVPDVGDLQPWTATLGGEIPAPTFPHVDITAQSNDDFHRIVDVLRDAVERRVPVNIWADGGTVSFVPVGIITHDGDLCVRVLYGGNDAHDAESRA